MNRKITLVVLFVIALIAALIYYLFLPFQDNIEENIITEWSETSTFSTTNRPPIDGFEGFLLGGKYEFVQTEFNFFNPVYSLIVERPSQFNVAEKNLDITVIYLKRENNVFVVEDYNSNRFNGSYEEVRKVVTDFDISKDFPNKEEYEIVNLGSIDESDKTNITDEEYENSSKTIEELRKEAQDRLERLGLNPTEEYVDQVLIDIVETQENLDTNTDVVGNEMDAETRAKYEQILQNLKDIVDTYNTQNPDDQRSYN
jgi:hypothetical protein